MKKILILGLCLISFGCSEVAKQAGVPSQSHPSPYYLKATVQDSIYPGAQRNVKLCVDSDTDKTNGCSFSDTISMSSISTAFNVINIPNGIYYVYALKDVDTNGSFNSGDLFSQTQQVIIDQDIQILSNIILDTVKP